MNQLIREIGGTALGTLSLVVSLPFFTARISCIAAALIASLRLATVQPRLQLVKVKKENLRY